MITLDGQPLIVDNQGNELEEFIRKYISTDSYLPWLRRSYPGFGMAGITYPVGMRMEPVFKLNRFRWPTGACRWAYGHFLADVNACNLQKIINDSSSPSGGYKTVPFVLDTSSSGGETLSTNVYVFPPTPLSGIRGVNGLYLLTIVDERFYWWYSYVGDLQITSATTWQGMYQGVTTAMGITNFTNDTINPAYLQPSTMFNLPYETCPQVLDAIAFNVGQRIIRNYDGSVQAQSYNSAYQKLTTDFSGHTNRQLIAGGKRFDSPL